MIVIKYVDEERHLLNNKYICLSDSAHFQENLVVIKSQSQS